VINIETRPRPPCFLRVRCSECGNEQVIFSHASSVVKCLMCSKTLAIPRGGKAEIKTSIIEVLR
jgi:small subunit ribosomal protein S27e